MTFCLARSTCVYLSSVTSPKAQIQDFQDPASVKPPRHPGVSVDVKCCPSSTTTLAEVKQWYAKVWDFCFFAMEDWRMMMVVMKTEIIHLTTLERNDVYTGNRIEAILQSAMIPHTLLHSQVWWVLPESSYVRKVVKRFQHQVKRAKRASMFPVCLEVKFFLG